MHQEAITSEAKELLSALARFKGIKNFYLVGETALALQIGHRISIDLDWFGQKPLPKNLLSNLKKFFPNRQILTDVFKAEELTVRIDGVQTTFFHYPFPWAAEPVEGEGFKLASIKQIAFMKAQTINRRADFKDYADLFFILRDNAVFLQEIIDKGKTVFKEDFNRRLFLELLVYMEDIEESGVDFLAEKPSKQEIQKFFEKIVKSVKI